MIEISTFIVGDDDRTESKRAGLGSRASMIVLDRIFWVTSHSGRVAKDCPLIHENKESKVPIAGAVAQHDILCSDEDCAPEHENYYTR